ncbi:MAG: hypothetical protein ACI39R_05140 [Lachnospiraceae bacterium]
MTKKKSTLIKVATLLMVLALGTTCFTSGTLAKYVTSNNGGDSARVAKFGVTVTANGETFAEEYDTHDQSVAATIAQSVVSSTDENGNQDKVVAPGTSGDMASMTLTGTPEVAVRVSYDATLELTGWTTDGTDEYCPIEIEVNSTVYKIGGNDTEGNTITTVDELETAVKTAIENYSQDYEANTDLSTVSVSVSWAWPFSTGDENDVKDTALGNRAAAGNAATIKLTVKTTVTQID